MSDEHTIIVRPVLGWQARFRKRLNNLNISFFLYVTTIVTVVAVGAVRAAGTNPLEKAVRICLVKLEACGLAFSKQTACALMISSLSETSARKYS